MWLDPILAITLWQKRKAEARLYHPSPSIFLVELTLPYLLPLQVESLLLGTTKVVHASAVIVVCGCGNARLRNLRVLRGCKGC